MKSYFLLVVICFLAFLNPGCKKNNTGPLIIHKDTIVTGNKIPPYSGVTNTILNNYINRLYIDLLGFEPQDAVLSSQALLLKNSNYSDSARLALVNSLMKTDAYLHRNWINLSAQLLNSVDSGDIEDQITLFGYLIKQYTKTGEVLYVSYFTYENTKLRALLDATSDWAKGKIQLNDIYSRFINNYVYDQINMGSDNFVKACFQNLLNRQPTISELNSSVDMCDSKPTSLFLQNGSSKSDFINIITNSLEFYEGICVNNYLGYLLRKPSSIELNQAETILSKTKDLKSFQTKLLISKEYAGF